MKKRVKKTLLLEQSGSIFVLIGIVAFAIFFQMTSVTVFAKEQTQPPHLIQSVSEQDIYEGLLGLGVLECSVLQEDDWEKACENVAESVVRIDMGKAYGSGVIWDMQPERIIVATNKHVVEYWTDLMGFIYFPQGYFVSARILGVSQHYDVAFMEIDREIFTYDQVEHLKAVHKGDERYKELQAGDAIFTIGSGKEMQDFEYHEGKVIEKASYIELFESDMLYAYGFAKPGMSGGGCFDAKGNLLGLLAGGASNDRTATVPVYSVESAYEEVLAREEGK